MHLLALYIVLIDCDDDYDHLIFSSSTPLRLVQAVRYEYISFTVAECNSIILFFLDCCLLALVLAEVDRHRAFLQQVIVSIKILITLKQLSACGVQ